MITTGRLCKGAAACTALALSGIAQAFTVPTFSGPGVGSPGYPDFWSANTQASVVSSPGGTFTLSVTGGTAMCSAKKTFGGCSVAIFNFPSGAYLVGSEAISITATFNSNGVLQNGTYTVVGSLPASTSPTFGMAPNGVGWGTQPVETLLTANLTADTIDSTHEALGFREVITGGWADQPMFTGAAEGQTVTESVWLYSLLATLNEASGNNTGNSSWNAFLAQLKAGKGLQAGTFYGIASIATVPIPGALVLLGTGLAGLAAGFARRRPELAAS